MIKFNDIKYVRVDYEETKSNVENLIAKLDSADTFETFLSITKDIINIQNHIEQMTDYADIRNMRESDNQYYDEEINYWNDFKPKFDLLFNPFYEICLNTSFKEKLKKYIPKNFFLTIEYILKTSSEETVELEQRDNALKKRYRNIIAEEVEYNGRLVRISTIAADFSNVNRDVRKKAHNTYNDFFLSKQSELDDIFYEMIQVRQEIAKRLGFKSYSEYSLYKLRRFGYDYIDIKKFRDNIIKYIKPICKDISKWNALELGLDELLYYDSIYFKEMPKTLYKERKLLEKIYESISKYDESLATFYKEMLDNEYIDLESRTNKVGFGITNYLTELGYPVITGNFKGTYYDVKMTSHEFGHAYQKYNASMMDKNYIISSLLKYPTFEVAEIFSNTMQLILMNYVDNVFDENDYQKYCFMALLDFIRQLPYMCLVDEFQEIIYDKQYLSKSDMRLTWLELSKKYGLEKNNTGHENLESGGFFYRQNHIFLNPFYYIDYALSYFCATTLWYKSLNNLELFKEIASVASYYPFDELINKYNMPNPFEEETVEEIANFLENELIKRRVK